MKWAYLPGSALPAQSPTSSVWGFPTHRTYRSAMSLPFKATVRSYSYSCCHRDGLDIELSKPLQSLLPEMEPFQMAMMGVSSPWQQIKWVGDFTGHTGSLITSTTLLWRLDRIFYLPLNCGRKQNSAQIGSVPPVEFSQMNPPCNQHLHQNLEYS